MTAEDECSRRLIRFYQDVRPEVPSMPSVWVPRARRRPAHLVSVFASVALVVIAAAAAVAIRTAREEARHGPPPVDVAQAQARGAAAMQEAGGPLIQDLGTVGGGAWVLNGAGLYRTDDWGARWQAVKVPVADPGAVLVAATFTDSRHGWAAAAVPQGVTVYRTADGGTTWRASRLPAAFPNGSGRSHLSFADAAHGWAVVELPHGGAAGVAAVFVTDDGGVSWTQLANAPTVAGVRFLGPLTGWGVDDIGRLYRTGDGGRTWRDVALPVGVDLPTFVAGEGVAFGAGPSGLMVVVSHDAGATWTVRPGPAGVDVSHYGSPLMIPFSAPSPRHWVIDPGPSVYESDDAGATWQAIRPNLEWPVAAVALFTSASDGWIVVTEGVCRGAKNAGCSQASLLLVTHDGGRTLVPLAPPQG